MPGLARSVARGRRAIGFPASVYRERGSPFTPLSLFAAGEQGYWLDPSDFSTMFQDTAGATPVTAVGQSVRRWLDKSGRGNHFTQTSTSNAPILGRNPIVGTRNLLTRSEEFDNASWVKFQVSVTANAALSPDGTSDAEKVVEAANAGGHFVSQAITTTAAAHTFTCYLKAAERSWAVLYASGANVGQFFDLGAGAVGATFVGAPTSASITPAGNGWYRCSVTFTATTAVDARVYAATANGVASYTGDGTSGIFIWGAQLEAGSTATAYQRVGSTFDVTQAGVQDCYYLAYDGTDDWLQSGTITPGTDKVQVFAGVRKLSDAADGIVVESSASATDNGKFNIFAPGSSGTARYQAVSRGTASSIPITTSTQFNAPTTNTITLVGEISTDTAVLRANGSQVSSQTTDQGTGNYLAYPVYIGRRAGTSLPFNGRIYQLICRFGPNLTAAQIQQVETFVNQRTGAY